MEFAGGHEAEQSGAVRPNVVEQQAQRRIGVVQGRQGRQDALDDLDGVGAQKGTEVLRSMKLKKKKKETMKKACQVDRFERRTRKEDIKRNIEMVFYRTIQKFFNNSACLK